MKPILVLSGAALLSAGLAVAQQGEETRSETLQIKIDNIDASGVGRPIGRIYATDTPQGLLLDPELGSLSPGIHGFHIHENANCGPEREQGRPVAGKGAGSHWDPEETGKHEGPYGQGHLGDLPALYADQDGRVDLPVLAPRLRLADLRDRSLIIHTQGDNYSDAPEKDGGGGNRVACGTVHTVRGL